MDKIIEKMRGTELSNVIINENGSSVSGWYGLNYFEIHTKDDKFIRCTSKEEFLDLYNIMTEMKKCIELSNNLNWGDLNNE